LDSKFPQRSLLLAVEAVKLEQPLLSLKERYCAREQRLDWMLPVSRAASEGVVQSSDQDEIVTMVSMGTKTAADAARLFNVHPATVSRLLAKASTGSISPDDSKFLLRAEPSTPVGNLWP
jgi:hypothetical protein